MAEPASGFVTPTGWFPAPELTPTLGPLSDQASASENWMYWAMLPPPPPPSSLPAAESKPSSEAQPPAEAQALPEAPPPFDAQILPGAQPPFHAQSALESQPQFDGQPYWNYQASTSWYWAQSPGIFPQYQNSHNTPGTFLLSVPLTFILPVFSHLSDPRSSLPFWYCLALLESGH